MCIRDRRISVGLACLYFLFDPFCIGTFTWLLTAGATLLERDSRNRFLVLRHQVSLTKQLVFSEPDLTSCNLKRNGKVNFINARLVCSMPNLSAVCVRQAGERRK